MSNRLNDQRMRKGNPTLPRQSKWTQKGDIRWIISVIRQLGTGLKALKFYTMYFRSHRHTERKSHYTAPDAGG